MTLGSVVTGTGTWKPVHGSCCPGARWRRSADAPAVWVVDPKTNTVSLKTIVVESYETKTIVVSRGLQIGDRVVTDGGKLLRPGQIVVSMGAKLMTPPGHGCDCSMPVSWLPGEGRRTGADTARAVDGHAAHGGDERHHRRNRPAAVQDRFRLSRARARLVARPVNVGDTRRKKVRRSRRSIRSRLNWRSAPRSPNCRTHRAACQRVRQCRPSTNFDRNRRNDKGDPRCGRAKRRAAAGRCHSRPKRI